MERRTQFLEGVERGIAADRGDLIDHADVVSRAERLFKS